MSKEIVAPMPGTIIDIMVNVGDEVLEYMTNFLKTFRTFAPVEGYRTITENKGRATRAAYDALLADIALWQFDYEAVISHVQRIEAADNHLLLFSDRWFELFYPGNTAESIFEMQFDDNLNQRIIDINL